MSAVAVTVATARARARARADALDAATPVDRDRFVDLVRLVALVVVVAAH